MARRRPVEGAPLFNPWQRVEYVAPPGTFKCTVCGRRKPDGQRQPDLPDVHAMCRLCWPATQRIDDRRDVRGATAADFTITTTEGV